MGFFSRLFRLREQDPTSPDTTWAMEDNGSELVLEIGNIPAHDMRPRWIAVGLAALVLAAGLYVAFSPAGKPARAALEDERARLMRELVSMEERRRTGKPKPKDAERRPVVMAELERVLAALDDEAPGGGQGAAA